MSFLYPSVLYGLLALLIPVLIHLFNFRRAKKVYFSNTYFIKSLQKKSSSKLKIKYWLILVSRLAFIFLLVVAFAQPYWEGEDRQASKTVQLYLDNSYSMLSTAGNGKSGLDVAIANLRKIKSSYPRGTSFYLITNDYAPSSQRAMTGEELEELLSEVEVSSSKRSIASVISRLDYLNSTSESARDIYYLSDMQKSQQNQGTNPLDTSNRWYVMPVETLNSGNVYIDSLFLTDPFLVNGVANELNFLIRNAGNEPIENLPVRLFINETQVANSSITIKTRSTAQLKLTINFPLSAQNRCRLSFEDYPITFDNEYYFALNQSRPVTVIELTEDSAKRYVSNVFGNESLFDYQQYTSRNVDYNALNSADLIVLNQLTTIPATLLDAIASARAVGTDIMLFPAIEGSMEPYQSITGKSLYQSTISEQLSFAPIKAGTPFFDRMFDTDELSFTMPQGQPALTWQGGTPLLRFITGGPVLSHFEGSSDVYLWSVPLSKEYANLVGHALFVPVMYRIATRSKGFVERLEYSIDESTFVIELDSLDATQIYQLKQGEQQFVPDQRVVNDRLYLTVPADLLQPGFYELMAGEQPKKLLAFNIDVTESELMPLTIAEVREQFNGKAKLELRRPAAAVEDYELASTPVGADANSLWKYAMMLALLSLLLEVALIRFL